MLSAAARAYLIWQAFDYVHRSGMPVRFARLMEEVEDLAAWPEFREAAVNDPRFLVVGDSIDIATVGIHTSAPVEEIILQTLDLVRVPVSNQMLVRLVKRLRPDLAGNVDPVELALATGQVLRPWTGHLARRRWLKEAESIPLPLWLPSTPADAAREVLAQTPEPISVAGLAVALAERFDLTPGEAYQTLGADSAFLFLPGGGLALYDAVADEVGAALGAEYSFEYAVQPEKALAGGVAPADLPHDLVRRVVGRCRERQAPVSTGEILQAVLGLSDDDTRYVSTFRAVTAQLSVAPELVPVGENRWYPATLVPAAVWMPIQGDVTSHDQRATPAVSVPAPEPLIRFTAGAESGYVAIRVTERHIQVGALSDPRLSGLLPDQPIIQMLSWSGIDTPVWYNSEHNALYGLAPWLHQRGVAPGDTVTVSFRSGRLSGTARQGVRLPEPSGRSPARHAPRSGSTQRALLPAITEILDRAGGSLERDQLMALLNEEDSWISWSDVQPLFERLPILKYDRGRCYLVRQLAGRRQQFEEDGVVRAEILGILSTLPDDLRNDPRVLHLARLVAMQPRISARDEALLLPAAQRSKGPEWERLVVGHLRYALTNLLHRRDLPLLLPQLEDYFQHAAMGVMTAVDRYDRSRAPRLQHALGWSVMAAVSYVRYEYLLPIYLTHHVTDALVPLLVTPEPGPDEPDSGEEAIPETPTLAQFWASVTWEAWEDLAEDYEEGAFQPIWVTMGESSYDPEYWVAQADLSARIDAILWTLGARERDVIERRYGFNGDEETLEQIGQLYGVTRERIRQIEAGAIRVLRARSRKWRELRAFLSD